MRASDQLPERFNAASWFVGLHVGEGRGGRTAIVTDLPELPKTATGKIRRFVLRVGTAVSEGPRDGRRTPNPSGV